MLACGTIAATFDHQLPSVPWGSCSDNREDISAALRAITDELQASRSLSQKTEKLKDLRELDPQVLSEIHQTYFTELFRYAQYRVSDATLAEDIASEVFLRLIEAVHSNNGPNSSIRGWLFGTTANLVNDYFRQSYLDREIQVEAALDTHSSQTAEAINRVDQQDYLSAAINELTEEQQHVIALRFGSELSIEETSMVMSKNENAVKALQYRAIRSLRRELGVDE